MRGAYILVIEVEKSLRIKVGKLGKIDFKKGFYCYVGSALGKSLSLENRIKRHLRKRKRLKWHIDYLLKNSSVRVRGFILFPTQEKVECLISKKIEEKADKTIERFGASDCKCRGHLHYFKEKKKLIKVLDEIRV